MANALKKRVERVGMTAQTVMFPDIPRITPAVVFPDSAVRKRVVLERPAPAPVRRTCATCGAVFDDYTQRPNTVYCRASCKNKMSEIKRDTAVFLLAEQSHITLEDAWLIYDRTGLQAVEKCLNGLGFTFNRDRKGWVKA